MGQGIQVAPGTLPVPPTVLPSLALRNPEAEPTGGGAQTSAGYGGCEEGIAGHWGSRQEMGATWGQRAGALFPGP